MIKKIEHLIKKHREIIVYVFFGAVTTAVNFAVYFLVKLFLTNVVGIVSESEGENGLVVNIAQVVAWIAAVLVAFVTNKRYVFEEKEKNKNKTLIQLAKFTSMRLASFFFEMVTFNLMVVFYNLNDFLSKVVIAVVVVILNYIISKIFIFTKKDKS